MLQVSSAETIYEITESITCEVASCDSVIDSANAQSIIASTVAPLESAFSSGQFQSVVNTNILNIGSIDADIVACSSVWGVVTRPQLEVISPDGVSTGPSSSTGLYFPDWENNSGTCVQGEAPLYMQLNPEVWLYDSLEGCCNRYYGGFNLKGCLNNNGSGMWYVSYSLGKCVTDCEEGQGGPCGGLARSITDDLFADPRSCCVAKLPWVFVEFCEAQSLISSCYAGTGKYYRGDTVGSNFCVRDCIRGANGNSNCGGLVEETSIELHDTAEECCSAHFNWIENELCAARSDRIALNKYWPDKSRSKCILDSETPAKDLSISIYNSIADCCSEGIHWLSAAECSTASGNTTAPVASNMFFVKWDFMRFRCVQDCEGDAPCGGVGQAQPWDELYDTARECCAILNFSIEDCFEN